MIKGAKGIIDACLQASEPDTNSSCKYISYSSITKLLTFLRSSPAEASAVLTPFMTSADSPAIETVFCAIFVVPAALSFDAEVIPSIASVILEIDATNSSEDALKSDTRSLILDASIL